MTLQPKEPLCFEKGTEREIDKETERQRERGGGGKMLRNKDRRGRDIERLKT